MVSCPNSCSSSAWCALLNAIDEAVVMNELRQAGFQLEQESDFLRNPSDPRDQAFFDMKIPTDKFALRFVKP